MNRSILGLLVLVLSVQGCSLGEREDWAKAIRDGYETAADLGAAYVKQTVTVEVVETTIRQTPKPLIAKSEGTADFSEHRARLVEKAKRKAEVVYDDLVIYLQRSKSSIAGGKQTWASFDLEREPDVDLDDNDRRLAVGAALISPVLAMEVLDGILTGSLEKKVTKPSGISEYTARLAPDAAVVKITDEDRKEGVARLFETLGVQQDDFPVSVWIDQDDRIKQIRFVMRQQKDRVNAFILTSTWWFGSYAPAKKTIELPSKDETLRSPRFREFVTELIREF